MEPIQGSEMSAFNNNQTPGKYPEELLSSLQHGKTWNIQLYWYCCATEYLKSYRFWYATQHKYLTIIAMLHKMYMVTGIDILYTLYTHTSFALIHKIYKITSISMRY